MPSICFYFQVHQPYRLKEYTFFDIGYDHHYENEELNRRILNKVADKCYIPTNKLMLELIKKHKGKFKIAYSLSGVVLEQFEKWRPDVLQSFVELGETGCVEFLSETYTHSLSFLYSKSEFERQVLMHREKIEKLFNQTPKVFRNTELIYYNELAKYAEDMGFKGIICEGVDRLLAGRSPNYLYQAPNVTKIKSLLKNYRLSDDIAFRFSDKGWVEHPLTADKFAGWVHDVAGNGDVINLFMDYETFGEHQWEESGVFEFMRHMPDEVIKHKDFDFLTPSEVVDKYPVRGIYDTHLPVSWADTERDLSAWLSNSMQEEAMGKIYSFEADVKALNNKDLLAAWSRLLTSDHFYYMSTKYWADGDVHKYFSPYNSPYDAYIFYMNAIADLEIRLKKLNGTAPLPVAIEEVEKPQRSMVIKKVSEEKAVVSNKSAAKKVTEKKEPVKKVVAKKVPVKKAVAQKTPAKKASAKKETVTKKEAAPKRAAAKKTVDA
ncbi:MAG: polysaccharide deacetylase family protein [Bacteroidia bacterium]